MTWLCSGDRAFAVYALLSHEASSSILGSSIPPDVEVKKLLSPGHTSTYCFIFFGCGKVVCSVAETEHCRMPLHLAFISFSFVSVRILIVSDVLVVRLQEVSSRGRPRLGDRKQPPKTWRQQKPKIAPLSSKQYCIHIHIYIYMYIYL